MHAKHASRKHNSAETATCFIYVEKLNCAAYFTAGTSKSFLYVCYELQSFNNRL